MIPVNIVLNFCGQWTLEYENNKPIRKLYEDGFENIKKYWKLTSSQYDNPNIFYFTSIKNPSDSSNMALINGFQNIKVIKFHTKHHGVPFLKCTLPQILNMTYDDLCDLSKRTHFPILFDIKQIGFLNTSKFIIKDIIRKIKK